MRAARSEFDSRTAAFGNFGDKAVIVDGDGCVREAAARSVSGPRPKLGDDKAGFVGAGFGNYGEARAFSGLRHAGDAGGEIGALGEGGGAGAVGQEACGGAEIGEAAGHCRGFGGEAGGEAVADIAGSR